MIKDVSAGLSCRILVVEDWADGFKFSLILFYFSFGLPAAFLRSECFIQACAAGTLVLRPLIRLSLLDWTCWRLRRLSTAVMSILRFEPRLRTGTKPASGYHIHRIRVATAPYLEKTMGFIPV
jgi:hypothetical protein